MANKIMRVEKFLTYASLLGLTTLVSCGPENLDVNFPMPAGNIEFTIQPTATAGNTDFTVSTLTFNLDSVCTANSVTNDQVKSIKVKSCILDIDPTLAASFDPIDWIEAYVNTTSLPLSLLAAKNPLPKTGSKTLSLDLQELELLDYFKTSGLTFTARGRNNAAIAQPIPVKVSIEFNVTALLAN